MLFSSLYWCSLLTRQSVELTYEAFDIRVTKDFSCLGLVCEWDEILDSDIKGPVPFGVSNVARGFLEVADRRFTMANG